jgi:hypothetical protein
MFMQDVGSMENTSGKQADSTLKMVRVVCRIPWTLSACWKSHRNRFELSLSEKRTPRLVGTLADCAPKRGSFSPAMEEGDAGEDDEKAKRRAHRADHPQVCGQGDGGNEEN